MKKTILAATAAIAALGFAAQASAADVTINGAVAPACSFSLPSSTVTIASNMAKADGTLDTAVLNGLNLGSASDVWCNGVNAKLSIEATPLVNAVAVPGGVPTGFTNRVDYVATFDDGEYFMADVSRTDGATLNNYGVHASAVLSGTTSFDSLASDNGKKLVAGAYTGVVTVTMVPGA